MNLVFASKRGNRRKTLVRAMLIGKVVSVLEMLSGLPIHSNQWMRNETGTGDLICFCLTEKKNLLRILSSSPATRNHVFGFEIWSLLCESSIDDWKPSDVDDNNGVRTKSQPGTIVRGMIVKDRLPKDMQNTAADLAAEHQ